MRNAKAVSALLLAFASIGVLVVAGARTRLGDDEVTAYSYGAIPVSFVAAVLALSLSRRARFDFQRTLGRAGGHAVASLGRSLGLLGLMLSLAAALAVGVWFLLKHVA
jgi:hypothetical protein